jgi:hypothetical protein
MACGVQFHGSSWSSLVTWRASDTGKNVGKPCLRIDAVDLGRHHQRSREGGTVSTTVRSSKEPCLPAKCEGPQRSLGSIVRQANPTVIEE